MIQKTFIMVLAILIFQSCSVGTSETFKNDNIDKDKREQIKILNDKLIKAIIEKDVGTVKLLMSDELLKEASAADINELISQVCSSLESQDYKMLDEYNVMNSTTGIGNTLISGVSGDNNYFINYKALNDEMYTSLILPKALYNEILITVIYGKYDDQWKINILQFGQYSLFKKTAPEFYKLAKESYEKAYLIDAVNYIGLAKQCLSPADVFKYQISKDIDDFQNRVMEEVNSKFKFPLTLDSVETKPKVFRIYPEMINEGFFPMVYYLSDINIQDTASLKIENEQLKKEMGRIFKGIDQDKKYVFYWAFNEFPDGKKPVKHYGFIDNPAK